MRRHDRAKNSRAKAPMESGFTLLETMIAIAVLLIGISGLKGVFGYSAGMSKSQGDISTRTIAYTHNKMEHLLSPYFTDGNFTFNAYLDGNMTVNAPLGNWNLTSSSSIPGGHDRQHVQH